MSFLNPVNEPVLRFSSTDADAPQIDYNARVAGDVKTVLKACLVTGYGDKASAGWSIVNEVDHVAEFVSPSAAMSDYRLGIDDTSTSSTTWYYQYQDVRRNPFNGLITKGFSYLTAPDPRNGWQLLATARAVVLVESVVSRYTNSIYSRITYWGSLKLAVAETGESISFLNFGYDANPDDPPSRVISTSSAGYRYILINGRSNPRTDAANMSGYGSYAAYGGNSDVSISSNIYLFYGNEFAGKQPAILLNTPKSGEIFDGVFDMSFADRSFLSICVTQARSNTSDLNNYARVILIPLDYWEF